MLTEKIAHQLIEAAIAAPSGDNLQPWKFSWDGQDSIDFMVNPDIDESLFNIKYQGQKIASLMAIGAAVENVRVCAGHLGYALKSTYFPPSDTKNCVVRAKLIIDNIVKKQNFSALHSFIPKRCVNRKLYNGQRIDQDLQQEILDEAQKNTTIKISWINDENRRRTLAQMARKADQILFETQGLLSPLMDSIRWTKKQTESSRDGLPIETLELDWMKKQSFRMFTNWPLVNILNQIGLSKIASQPTEQMMNSSSAIVLFSFEGKQDLIQYICGGEIFEKFWLLTAAHGMSFQPMAGIAFLINRVDLLNGEGLSQKNIQKIHAMKKELIVLLDLKSTETPLMFSRIGYAPPPSSKTLRKK